MQIFLSNDEKTFYYNNRKYVRNFIVHKVGETHIQVLSAYDSRMQLMSATHYSEVMVDEATFQSQQALMDVLSPIVFAKTDGDADQNNVAQYFQYGLLSGSGVITSTEVADYINNNTLPLVVSETQTPTIFEFLRIENEVTTKYLFMFTRGKGVWGTNAGGFTVLPNWCRLLSVQTQTPEDIEYDENSQINYLGVIEDGDFVSVANETEWNFSNLDTSYYFSYTKEGVLYFVLFTGEPGVYGGNAIGTDDFTDSDFISTTNSQVQPTPGLQAVLQAGYQANGELGLFYQPNTPQFKYQEVWAGGLYHEQANGDLAIRYPDNLQHWNVEYTWPAKSANDTIAMVSDLSGITSSTGLEAIDEGNGIGWRLIGQNPINYGAIAYNAIDLSISDYESDNVGATGPYSFAVGYRSTSSNYASAVVGGTDNTSTGLYSITIGGTNNIASGSTSIAGGYYSQATQGDAIAIGHNNTASGQQALAIGGFNNIASGHTSIAMGMNNTSTGYLATAIGGYGNEANGDNSVVLGGNGNISSNIYSSVLGGVNNEANEYASSVIGGGSSKSNGSFSFATGYGNETIGVNSFVNGRGNIAATYSETVIGHYATVLSGNTSEISPNDTVFRIGIGTVDTVTLEPIRKDGLRVFKNGLLVTPEATISAITSGDVRTLITKEYFQAQLTDVYKQGSDSDPLINRISFVESEPVSGNVNTVYFIQDGAEEFKGSVSVSANGTTTISVPHSLGEIPTYINVQAKNSASSGITYVDADSININVHYSVAPTGTLEYWIAYNN